MELTEEQRLKVEKACHSIVERLLKSRFEEVALCFSDIEKTVTESRYVNNLKWEEIADMTGLSIRQCQRIRKNVVDRTYKQLFESKRIDIIMKNIEGKLWGDMNTEELELHGDDRAEVVASMGYALKQKYDESYLNEYQIDHRKIKKYIGIIDTDSPATLDLDLKYYLLDNLLLNFDFFE